MKTFTQTLTSDLHEAAIARYAGYEVRWLPNEKQWAIRNPGDLEDLFADVRAGAQTISNAVAFLKVYDEMRQIKFGEREEATPQSTIVAEQGKEFYTRDMMAAAALIAFGYPVLRVDPPEGDKGQWRYPRFFFADDGSAMSRSRAVTAKIRAEMDRS